MLAHGLIEREHNLHHLPPCIPMLGRNPHFGVMKVQHPISWNTIPIHLPPLLPPHSQPSPNSSVHARHKEDEKSTCRSEAISLSTDLSFPSAASLISSSLSTFSYSFSTNFANNRIRGGVSDSRFVNSETRIPSRCSSSSNEDVAPSLFFFPSPLLVSLLRMTVGSDSLPCP
jgi:hypothetical protein